MSTFDGGGGDAPPPLQLSGVHLPGRGRGAGVRALQHLLLRARRPDASARPDSGECASGAALPGAAGADGGRGRGGGGGLEHLATARRHARFPLRLPSGVRRRDPRGRQRYWRRGRDLGDAGPRQRRARAEVFQWLQRWRQAQQQQGLPSSPVRYVVLDDNHVESFLANGLIERFVRTQYRCPDEWEEGLTAQAADAALAILATEDAAGGDGGGGDDDNALGAVNQTD